MKRRTKIALVTSTLEGGGAARVIVNMANYWVQSGCSVDLFSFEDGSSPSFYPVHDDVKVHYLNLAKISPTLFASLKNNWMRILKIRSFIVESKPDIVISFIDTANVRVLVSLIGTGIPVIVSERIHPAYEDIGPLWSFLRLLTYPLARSVVMQTDQSKEYFPRFLKNKLRVIPNPVIVPGMTGEGPTLPSNTVLAVGRLYEQKGYDLLLKAYAQLVSQYPEWTLAIAGEGPLLDGLIALSRTLGIETRVRFLGQVKNIGGLLKQADVYVMSSRYEGFPNALCEAMACGLPCVCTDCPSGPSELIRHQENGLLVANSNIDELAMALGALMSNSELRKALGESARGLIESFAENRIMAMWDKQLRSAFKD